MKVLDLAKAIINYGTDVKAPVTNLTLQNILYYCQLSEQS